MSSVPRKPYHEMSLEEYAATEHSVTVPRWSILAFPPESFTLAQLCQFNKDALAALASLWGVRRDGKKQQLAERILRRIQFRLALSKETETSLSRRRRKDLAAIAKEAGIYHPWLNKQNLAAALIQWREDTRRQAKLRVAQEKHEQIVLAAARKGLTVPRENLERYGFDATGEREATILGVPLTRALRTAPEALNAARTLPLSDFREWVKTNHDVAARLIFIEPGILGDGGDLFWREVQRAFAVPETLPLFA